MKKKDVVVSNLKILRTWAEVNPKFGVGLNSEDCKKAVGWIDDALELIEQEDEWTRQQRHRIALEKDDNLVGMLIMAAAVDLAHHRESHSAAIWPEWSEDTVTRWKEIEDRMKGTVCLNFDREKALKQIEEKVEQQKQIMGTTPKHDTSWRLGMIDGLWDAYRIVEDNIHRLDSKEGKAAKRK